MASFKTRLALGLVCAVTITLAAGLYLRHSGRQSASAPTPEWPTLPSGPSPKWPDSGPSPKWNNTNDSGTSAEFIDFDQQEAALLDTLPSTHFELAQLYTKFGDYSRAVENYHAARSQFPPSGDTRNRYVEIGNQLARVYLELGEFGEAKRLLDENVQMLERAAQAAPFPAEATINSLSDALGDTLAYLAEFHRETGDFLRAAELHERVLKQRKDLFGDSSRNYANALHNMGIFEWQRGNYDQAEELLRRELRITESFGPTGEQLAHSRESLALVLTQRAKFAEAKSLFHSALETYVRQGGTTRSFYRTASNLGYLRVLSGDRNQAERDLELAVDGRRRLLGDNHLDVADSLFDLARLHYVEGRFARSAALARESLQITRANVELSSSGQSERQQLAMSSHFRNRLDLMASAASHVSGLAGDAFAEILAWKGATLVRQRAMRNLSEQADVGGLFQELQLASARIASLSRVVPEKTRDLVNWKKTIASLTNVKEELESELSNESANYRSLQSKPSVQDLATSLPESSVLVDFFEYGHAVLVAEKGQFDATPTIMASIIRNDGSVVAVHLGASAPISLDIDRWREGYGASASSAAAGQRLREAIWLPLLPHLTKAEIVLVALDGPLGRLPLGALPGEREGSYLIEDFRIAGVPVPQLIPSLLNRSVTRRRLEKDLLLVGDVDYGGANETLAQSTQNQSALAPWERRGTTQVRGTTDYFPRLQQTSGEIAFIERLYQRQPWMNANGSVILDRQEATESRFRSLAPQCYQIHLATHGFFAAPEMRSAIDARNQHQSLSDRNENVVHGFSPGLLSGLVFSGANNPSHPDQDDGIMTADELAFLPLDGVELVVLSACETGLGQVAGGEGLIGIQRAVQISGARTTVASLWKVPDLATRVLMERFYEGHWDEKKSCLDALRDAQLWVLNSPELVRGVTREHGSSGPRRTPPEYWASFVLSGDWR